MPAIRNLALGALLGGLTLATACTENRLDCRDICDTVQACVAVNIDTSGCTDSCTAYSLSTVNAEAQAEACNDCLDVAGCAGASSCSGVCAFMNVPLE